MLGDGGRITLDLAPWKLAVLAALLVFAGFVYRRTFPPLPLSRRAILAALRLLSFLLLAALLLDPAIVSVRMERRSPVVLVLLDTSKSMSTRDCGGRRRIDAATSLLAPFVRSLEESGRAEVAVIPFSSSLAAGPAALDTMKTAAGEGTDIWGSLAAARSRYRMRSLSAVILASDGRVTRGMMTSGKGANVPVYTLGFGDTLSGADVSIDAVEYDRVAYRGSRTSVEALLGVSGFRGARIEVRLLEEGVVRDRRFVVIRTDPEIVSMQLAFVPGTEGTRRLTVEAISPGGEAQRENNAESFGVRVLKSRIRVLFIDRFPDWNGAFLGDVARRSERMEIEFVRWLPERGYVSGSDAKRWAFPASAEGFRAYDLVVVSDETELLADPRNAEALASYVRGGGNVLFLADEHSPLAQPRTPEALGGMLPLVRNGSPRVEFSEAAVRIAPAGFGNPVASALAEGIIEMLPPCTGRLGGYAASAGAAVPLVLRAGERELPFLAIGRSGAGLSAVVLGFPLWRWRLAGAKGSEAYEVFFGGLIQYLAEGARLGGLQVDSDRTVYRAGERIMLTAFAASGRIPEAVRGEVRLRSGAEETVVGTIVFESDDAKPGLYRARLGPLPPGEYAATVSAIRGGGAAESGRVDFSVTSVSVEDLAIARDGRFLARVAEATGGAAIAGPDLQSLGARLDLRPESVEHRSVRELRGSPLFFLLIVCVLAAEWILRKAWGLV